MIAVGIGFLLAFFPAPFSSFSVLLIWGGLALLLVNAGHLLRFVPTLFVAVLLALPGGAFRNARVARQTQERVKAQQEANAAAAKLAAEKAKAALEEAARTFPERQASIQERLAVIEGATKSKDWTTAQQRLQELQAEVTPLFASRISTTPDVVAIQNRVQTQQAAVSAHVKEQRAAEAEKKWAEEKKKRMEIAARDEAAERARRASWQPEPLMVSIRCARYAKEGILDGEANFVAETLAKRGKTYTMQGQIIGHNAFNARIAKRAVCKVYMDMKTGVETYSISH